MTFTDAALPPITRSLPRAKSADPRLLIFSVSLLLKTIAGVVFFGSIDLVNSAKNSLELLAGGKVHLPYLPTINAFLWFGGALAAILRVPLPLSLKLIPILFDSLLAVLVYDLVRRHEPRLALRAGLLYALSPLALLITSFHAQWDAMALFFLLLAFGLLENSPREPGKLSPRPLVCAVFGAIFGISLLIKPIGLPLLLLFPPRKRGRWLPDWPAVLGMSIVLGMGCMAFQSYGYSTIESFRAIFVYSAKGIQVFGLPFAPLLSRFDILQGYRLCWILPAMVGVRYLHESRRLSALDAILLFYLYCLATSGISPQYLLWPMPLLMATRRLRLAALYTAVATGFLLIYYSNPWASYVAFENLGVFAPLRSLEWLLPPTALEKHELLPVVHALGNVVFPACAMVAAVLVARSGRGKIAAERNWDNEWSWCTKSLEWYAVPPLLVCATMLVFKLTVRANEAHFRLVQIWNTLPEAYGLRLQSSGPDVVLARDSAGAAWPNAVVLLALFAAAWCVRLAEVRHERGQNWVKSFRISSGNRRVYTTFAIEFEVVREGETELMEQ